MTVIEASFNGTFRMILLLVLAWVVLRWFLRRQGATARGNRANTTTAPPGPLRPKGDVRIENVPPNQRPGEKPGGTIIDADFEEIK